MARSRLVYGVGPVRELLAAGGNPPSLLYVSMARDKKKGTQDPVAELASVARNRKIDVMICDTAELDAVVGPGHRHQGVVAVTGEYEYCDVGDILHLARERGQAPLIVALDSVRDPRNLGAIVRSAYLLGAHGLIVPRDRSASVTATTTKVSAGATEHLAIAQVTNLTRALEELKEADVWIAAIATADDAVPVWRIDGTGALCVVCGAEGTGIRPRVAKQCDFRVEIPMAASAVGSLNVSVAAGAVLYEVMRQRALSSIR